MSISFCPTIESHCQTGGHYDVDHPKTLLSLEEVYDNKHAPKYDCDSLEDAITRLMHYHGLWSRYMESNSQELTGTSWQDVNHDLIMETLLRNNSFSVTFYSLQTLQIFNLTISLIN